MHPSTPYHKFKEIIHQYNATCQKDSDKLPLITLHDLRHTSATLLISQNIDIAVVSERLGHSNISTTLDIYTHALKKADAYIEHPMKIIDDFWYAYDFENDSYYNTNIRATGKSFKIMKVYTSVAEMINDYNTTDVEVGEFVWINTGNVEDPDDSKLYLKTDTEWQLVGDLSGNRGIQGESAYEVAVNNGFIGTED